MEVYVLESVWHRWVTWRAYVGWGCVCDVMVACGTAMFWERVGRPAGRATHPPVSGDAPSLAFWNISCTALSFWIAVLMVALVQSLRRTSLGLRLALSTRFRCMGEGCVVRRVFGSAATWLMCWMQVGRGVDTRSAGYKDVCRICGNSGSTIEVAGDKGGKGGGGVWHSRVGRPGYTVRQAAQVDDMLVHMCDRSCCTPARCLS